MHTVPPRDEPSAVDVSVIETVIRQRVGRRVTGLVVSLDGQAIVLSGVADCYYTKQLVVAAVLALPGHRLSVNLIRVERKPAT